jgi:lauroyl/myristoyl acyltransferase
VRQLPGKGSVLGARYFGQLQAIGDRLSIIDPGEGVQRKLLDVFKNKACLYVTPDYMIPEDEAQRKSAFEVPIDFLGRRACVHAGGLRLAKRFEAQVVTVLFTQSGVENGRLVVEPFVLPTSGLKPDDLQQDLQLCMRRLEAQVLAHPCLWLDLKRKDLVKRLTAPQTS